MAQHSRVKPPSLKDGNFPFKRLTGLVREAGLRLGPKEDQPKTSHLDLPSTENEQVLFDQAMRDVVRATWRHETTSSSLPLVRPPSKPELEDLRLMQAALNGSPAPSVLDHPEYIEGWVGVAGKLFLPNLRNGMYSIQGQIDLHGLSRAQAQKTVEQFIVSMSRFRSCCVKIIHGRGINSLNDKAVLKDSLQRWLSTRRMSRHVLAYASAPSRDGGVGAIYVLLQGSLERKKNRKLETVVLL